MAEIDFGQTPTASSPTMAQIRELRRTLERWEIKDAGFTAEIGGRYKVDTSNNEVNIIIPEGMAAGDSFLVEDASLSWGQRSVIFHPAATGRGVKINGQESLFTCDQPQSVGAKLNIVAINETVGVSIT